MINEEEEEPTRCYLMFYYTYERLNMFRAALCPSSGAHDYICCSSQAVAFSPDT
jgi:hypothetical protein